MNQPYGIAIGADSKVYVADTFGGVIHAYDLAKSGYSAIDVKGLSLIGVAAGAGRLFVTDSVAGAVMGLDLKGRVLWSLGRKFGLGRPTGIVWGGDRLYVVDTLHHNVIMVSPEGAYLGAFGMQGNGPGQFNFPTNIARAPDGRLYVADTMNFRVQTFDAEGRFLGTFGKLGDGAGDFDKPKGIALDSAGHVYVVEGLNDVVQIFDASGRLLLVVRRIRSGRRPVVAADRHHDRRRHGVRGRLREPPRAGVRVPEGQPMTWRAVSASLMCVCAIAATAERADRRHLARQQAQPVGERARAP